MNIFLSGSPLIKTPRLLMLDKFVGPRPTIRTPSAYTPLIWHCE